MEFAHLFPHITVHGAIANIGAYSYLAIFLLTLCSGHIIPLPEEIILLIVGYSAGIGIVDFWPAIPAATGGLLTGDLILFAVGHHGGKLVQRLEHRLPSKTIARYRVRFKSKPVATIIGLRFISGVRIFSPIFSAVWKIPLSIFVLADFGALCIFTFLFIGLGFFFHTALLTLIGGVSVLRHLIFLGLLIIIGVFFALHGYRLFFTKPKADTSQNV